MRSLREERKTQKSSLISKEKVNKAYGANFQKTMTTCVASLFGRGSWSLSSSCSLLRIELETSLPGPLHREFQEFMRILMTFLGKTSRNPA